MLDYTSLLKKLAPEDDAEDFLRLRVGTVNAVNANGTLDITMSSGVIVPSVPKLATAYAPVGAVVQMISQRGSLMVIGAVGSSGANGPMVKTGTATGGPTAATSVSIPVNYGVTFPATPNVHVNLNNGAGSTSGWNVRAINITTTGFTVFAFGGSTTFSTTEWRWTAILAP
jgi:hypothetical protein